MLREKAQKDFAKPLLAPLITIRALKMYFIRLSTPENLPTFLAKFTKANRGEVFPAEQKHQNR